MAGIAPPLSRTAAAGRRAGLIVLGVLAALPVGFVAAHLFDSVRSEEHTSELQSLRHLVCRLLLEKKKGFLHKRGGEWHWIDEVYTADTISLRSVTSDNFGIIDTTGEYIANPEVIDNDYFYFSLTT